MPPLPGLVIPDVVPTGPPIFHVDADAFYVSVEQRDAPGLRGAPLVVADEVVCCASYEARARGVRSGMVVAHARGLCPELVAVAPRWEAYTDAAAALFDRLRAIAVAVEAAAFDEAFVDLGIDGWDDALDAAHRVRRDVRTRLGLPVSVGVARSKLLAKIANRRAKPDGVVAIEPDDEPRVRARLAIGELWGVGPATRAKLKVQGIESVAALAPYSPRDLASIVGTAMARRLFRIAHALDDARVLPRRPQPSARAARRPVQLPLALDLN
jgi:DNA polymerase-4